MNAMTIAVGAAAALWLGYRFYGRWIVRRVYGAGGFDDARLPSRAQRDDVDFVPTRRSVLFGHHYVTIAGAGPIVGPAVAVTWGWLPALLWVVLGCIFIGAVHDVGALLVSVRNRGRTVGDLAADILTPRVRLLFLAFIFLALLVVLAVFAFVIAGLFATRPESVLAVWIEVPLALLVGWIAYGRGGSMTLWSIVALILMYVAIGVGMLGPVAGLFTGLPIWFWILALFAYSYVASTLPVTRLLQPRDYINSHQLFLALAMLLFGFLVAPFRDASTLELVAPAVNSDLPAQAPLLYPFLFITVACGAISGFHCMVASGTTSRQLGSERDAQAIGYGAMILEGALAVIVILCCVSAAGFTREGWLQQYSAGWVGSQGLIARISGFIVGGASFIEQGLGLIGLEGSQVHGFLQTVITVVIVSFAATTMDSATRIQRYVVSELGGALGTTRFRGAHLPTLVAVGSGAALAMLVRAPGSTVIGSGGLTLWPIFGVTNQLLACLTFLVLTVWLAKRGKPVWATLLPLLFLVVTVSWAAVAQIRLFARTPGTQAHLIAILVVGLVLEGWMIVEGCLALGRARRGAAGIGADGVIRAAA